MEKKKENEELSGQPSEVDNNQLRAIIKANPLTTMWEVTKELNVEQKQIGKVKNLGKWVPNELTENQEASHSDLSSSLTTMNHFSIRLWHAMKSGFYTTTDNDQLSGWTEEELQSTFQSQPCTIQGHGHCLVVCCPSYPLELSESQQNHYIWEACSANWWHAPKTTMCAAGIGQWKGPNSSSWQTRGRIAQPTLQ